jgi:hypothetical protein
MTEVPPRADKDESIQALLEALNLARRDWIVRDYWDSDRFAIGIARPDDRRLAYVSTWQKPEGRFDLQLDVSSDTDPLGYETTAAIENCTLPDVIAHIDKHLAEI